MINQLIVEEARRHRENRDWGNNGAIWKAVLQQVLPTCCSLRSSSSLCEVTQSSGVHRDGYSAITSCDFFFFFILWLLREDDWVLNHQTMCISEAEKIENCQIFYGKKNFSTFIFSFYLIHLKLHWERQHFVLKYSVSITGSVVEVFLVIKNDTNIFLTKSKQANLSDMNQMKFK